MLNLVQFLNGFKVIFNKLLKQTHTIAIMESTGVSEKNITIIDQSSKEKDSELKSTNDLKVSLIKNVLWLYIKKIWIWNKT